MNHYRFSNNNSQSYHSNKKQTNLSPTHILPSTSFSLKTRRVSQTTRSPRRLQIRPSLPRSVKFQRSEKQRSDVRVKSFARGSAKSRGRSSNEARGDQPRNRPPPFSRPAERVLRAYFFVAALPSPFQSSLRAARRCMHARLRVYTAGSDAAAYFRP